MADSTTLDRKMRQIQALLDRADHPNTPEAEADSCRAKAEDMMNKYRIEETQLAASGALVDSLYKPVKRDIVVCPYSAEYMTVYWNIAYHILNHVGVRFRQTYGRNEQGETVVMVNVVGFESDIRYGEALMTNARLLFAERMEPKPRGDLSDEDNVYRMRSAGMERIRIAKLMGYGDSTSATAKVTRLYKRACEARGEDATLTGRSMNVKVFREEYVNGFISGLYNNLWRARNAADTGGAELVLAGRKEDVDEAFYAEYPHLRPKAAVGNGGEGRVAQRRRMAWTKADQKRWERSQTAAGRAGSAAGKRAADEVNIKSGKRPDAIN
jgi:hypothetical protein